MRTDAEDSDVHSSELFTSFESRGNTCRESALVSGGSLISDKFGLQATIWNIDLPMHERSMEDEAEDWHRHTICASTLLVHSSAAPSPELYQALGSLATKVESRKSSEHGHEPECPRTCTVCDNSLQLSLKPRVYSVGRTRLTVTLAPACTVNLCHVPFSTFRDSLASLLTLLST